MLEDAFEGLPVLPVEILGAAFTGVVFTAGVCWSDWDVVTEVPVFATEIFGAGFTGVVWADGFSGSVLTGVLVPPAEILGAAFTDVLFTGIVWIDGIFGDVLTGVPMFPVEPFGGDLTDVVWTAGILGLVPGGAPALSGGPRSEGGFAVAPLFSGFFDAALVVDGLEEEGTSEVAGGPEDGLAELLAEVVVPDGVLIARTASLGSLVGAGAGAGADFSVLDLVKPCSGIES